MLIHFTEDDRTQFCSDKIRLTRPKLTGVKKDVTCSRCLKRFKEPIHYDLENGHILCSSRIPKTYIRSTTQKSKVTCSKCKKNFDSKLTVIHYNNDGKPICSNAKNVDKRLKLSKTKSEVTCSKCKKKMSSTNIGISFYEDRRHGFCLELNRFTTLTLGRNMEDKLGYLTIMTRNKQSSTSCKFVSNCILLQFISLKKINFLRKTFDNLKIKHNRNELYVKDLSEVF